ncbi:hypothetical protein LOZ51_006833, partial [Ophidiomyces ophidiicola]
MIMIYPIALCGIMLVLVGPVVAQTFKSQINITMCNWFRPRVDIIRDTVYLDGGSLWWRRGFSDGTFGSPQNDGNPDGNIFTLPLSVPFNTVHTNLTGLFGRINPVNGAGNNIAPTYVDGAMFATENEFMLFGGLLRLTDSQSPPNSNQLLSYERYFWGPKGVTNWKQGFLQSRTNHNVTRYITHGAGVSVPSENRGYYFSGMRGKDWGEISFPEPKANSTANTLISVDMAEWRGEQWSNSTLPENIPPRGKSELTWIPVSDSGVLVAVGGVPHPQDTVGPEGLTMSQLQENKVMGEDFMKRIAVYNIASGKWHLQNTTGEVPPARSDFCSVVAEAKDGSSFNIYIYGGYGGNDREETSFDDVYILSIPSFRWIKAFRGRNEHGRRGHRCIKAYPDKMLVFGGLFIDPSTCLDGGIIQVFNLNTVEFQDVYDPAKWKEYKVPAVVTAAIGGNANGNATLQKPPSWDDNELEKIFSKSYSKPIKTYYPYMPVETSVSTPAPTTGSGLPKWVGPVIGVVLGLMLITGLMLAWLLWRRRKDRRYASSVGANSDNRKRVMRWIHGTGLPSKNIDATTTTTAEHEQRSEKHMSTRFSVVGNDSVITSHGRPTVVYSDLNEAAGSAVHELQDSSHPALGATVHAPLELPTEYNESPVSSRPRFPSDAVSFLSPISPEPGAVSPPASPPPEIRPTRPIHKRHNSSLSSMGFSPHPIINSNLDHNGTPINEEENMQRDHFVSGITEDFSSDSESHHEREPEFKT